MTTNKKEQQLSQCPTFPPLSSPASVRSVLLAPSSPQPTPATNTKAKAMIQPPPPPQPRIVHPLSCDDFDDFEIMAANTKLYLPSTKELDTCSSMSLSQSESGLRATLKRFKPRRIPSAHQA